MSQTEPYPESPPPLALVPAPKQAHASVLVAFAFGLTFLASGVLGLVMSSLDSGTDASVMLTFGILSVVTAVILISVAAVLRAKS